MSEEAIISSLQKKWKALSLLSIALIALAIALLLTACLQRWFQYSFFVWIIPAWLIVFALLTAIMRSWRLKENDVVFYLNRHIPQLEESSELLLKSPASLNLLQQMQVIKLKENIQYVSSAHPVNGKLKRSLLILFTACIAACIVLFLSKSPVEKQQNITPEISTGPQHILPAAASVTIKIKPPVYTGKPQQTLHDLNIIAEEGATVLWQVETNKPVKSISLKFSDTTTISLHSSNDEHTLWRGGKTLKHPGFYQLVIDSVTSDLYKLEIIKDQPPIITVQSPKPSVVIDFGEPQRISVQVNLADDYGINDAGIIVTVARGSGEAVKFSEHEIKFSNGFGGRRKNYALKKTIELPALGIKPGDQLYLYIKASDNNQQQTQSDTYIISLADTAALMSFDGVINGINLKPEYFRSQRQIIIETEQLLKDKAGIAQNAFNTKSNDLGIDQKLLRLRYGKFLGEEFEADIGGTDEDEHDDNGQAKTDADASFGNAQAITNEFAHQHDAAEDATFFDADTRNRLKAVLTEMWKAELQLRIFKPARALPFEYKALRLLKDLQQQSRVYVAKTNIKTPPLKPETRLSGDLDKIISPSTENNTPQKNQALIAAQQALSILENLKSGNTISNENISLLLQAKQLLLQQAAAAPGKYLAALQACQKILINIHQKQKTIFKDIITAQQGFQQMLALPAKTPSPATGVYGNSLSKEYFMNLNKDRQR